MLGGDLEETTQRQCDELASEVLFKMVTHIAEAADEARRHQAALTAIADYEAEFGRFSDVELADARARLAQADAGSVTPRRGRSRSDAA